MKEGYPIEWMQELKEKNDIVSTVARYVPLQQKGNRYWGCCPFHHEKTPSFTVNGQGGFYHCFGCGASGDAITFVKGMENVNFIDAVKILAERAGMEVPQLKGSDENAALQKKKRDRLYQATKLTANRYHENFRDNVIGEKARAYLATRGVTPEAAVTFGIGYASSSSDSISLLRENGFTDEEIVDCGVGTRSEKRIYDALAGRLIVPIINSSDKVIAFGGRILEKNSDKAKYRNTGASAIFTKGKNLYGVNLIKKLKRKQTVSEVVLVEGYMDVISLYKSGIYNAVAGMGTALTKEQAKELQYLTEKVYVCYDGDGAGQTAAERNMDIIASVGIKPYAMLLTDGMDPDDYVSKYGAEGFRKLMDSALPLIDYKLKLAADSFDLKTADGRAGYIVKALEIVKTLNSAAEQEVYLETLHLKSHVSIDALRRQLAGETVAAAPTAEKTFSEQQYLAMASAAEYVLNSLLYEQKYAQLGSLKKEWLTNEAHQQIYNYLADCSDKGKKPHASMLFDLIGNLPEVIAVIDGNVDFDEKKDVAKMAKYYEDSLAKLELAYVTEQFNLLLKEFCAAEGGKKAETAEQIKYYQERIRQLKR